LTDAQPIESAVADIQLFGSVKQVRLAQAFIAEFAATRTASLDPLLEELRKDLRAELQLESVSGKLVFLRYQPHAEGRRAAPSAASKRRS